MRIPCRAHHIHSLCEVFNFDMNRIHLIHDPDGFHVKWFTTIDGAHFQFIAAFLDAGVGNGDIDVADMTTSPTLRKEIHFVFLRQRPNGTWTYDVVPSTRQMAFRAMAAAFGFTQLVFERYGANATVLSFSASRRYPSRVRLYRRIAETLAREINGRVEEEHEHDDIVFNIHLPQRFHPGAPPV